jgi:hypothetical protein
LGVGVPQPQRLAQADCTTFDGHSTGTISCRHLRASLPTSLDVDLDVERNFVPWQIC